MWCAITSIAFLVKEGGGRASSGREMCWNLSSGRYAFEASAEKNFDHTCCVHVGDYQHCLMYFEQTSRSMET